MYGRPTSISGILAPLTIALVAFISYKTWIKPKADQPAVPSNLSEEARAPPGGPFPPPLSARPADQPIARAGGWVRAREPCGGQASSCPNQLLHVRVWTEKLT